LARSCNPVVSLVRLTTISAGHGLALADLRGEVPEEQCLAYAALLQLAKVHASFSACALLSGSSTPASSMAMSG